MSHPSFSFGAFLFIFGAIALVFALLTLRARKQLSLVAGYYKGTISWLTDDVRFSYKGVDFTLCRLASNGGLAGTGYYCSLRTEIESAENVVIVPSQAVKYVYAFSIPESHTWVPMGHTKVLVAGPAHRTIAERLSEPNRNELLRRIFPRKYSSVTITRQLQIGLGKCRRVQVLELTGMPSDLYEKPEVLQSLLDDMLILRNLVAA